MLRGRETRNLADDPSLSARMISAKAALELDATSGH